MISALMVLLDWWGNNVLSTDWASSDRSSTWSISQFYIGFIQMCFAKYM